MTFRSLRPLFAAALLLPLAAHAVGGMGGGGKQPQASSGSKDVKPGTTQDSDNYDLNATTMTVSHSATGSVERLLANDTSDATQIGRSRAAMRKLADNVGAGEYPTPVGARNADSPGLATLQVASPGQVRVQYFEIRGGAEIRYVADDPALVAALHAWLDSRLDARNTLAASADRGLKPRSP